MSFDVVRARAAGYDNRQIAEEMLRNGASPAEVADALATGLPFNLQGARQAGFRDEDIIRELVTVGAAADGASRETPARPYDPMDEVRQIPRQLGRTARIGIEGAGMLAQLPDNLVSLSQNMPAYLANAGIAGARALGADVDYITPPREYGTAVSGAASGLADRLGLPRAEGTYERAVDRVGTEAVVAGTTMGGGAALRTLSRAPEVTNLIREASARLPSSVADRFVPRSLREVPAPRSRPPVSEAEAVGTALATGGAANLGGAIGSGLAGHAAEEADLGPVGEFAASVVGGGLGAVAGAGAGAASNGAPGRVGQAAREGFEALRRPFTREGREVMAGRLFNRFAANPEQARSSMAAGDRGPLGLQTSAEASGDAGLAGVERGLRNQPGLVGTALAEADALRSTVRRDHLSTAAADRTEEGLSFPFPENSGTVADAVIGEVDAARQREASRTGLATRRVEAAAERLPAREDLDISGGTTARALRSNDQGARGATNLAYGRIDPLGQSRIPLDLLRGRAEMEAARLYGMRFSNPMPPAVEELLERIRRVVPNENVALPFAELDALRKGAGEVAANARRNGEREVAAFATEIVRAIDDTIDEAIGRARAPEGGMSLEDTLGLGPEPARHPDDPAPGPREGPPPNTRNEDARRFWQILRDVAKLREPSGPRGERSLVSWIISQGGVYDSQGDVLSAMGGDHRRRPGLINNRRHNLDNKHHGKAGQGGRTLEDLMQRAKEEGFFPEARANDYGAGADVSIGDFLMMIEDELHGRAVRYQGGGQRRLDAAARSQWENGLVREIDEAGLSWAESTPEEIAFRLLGRRRAEAGANADLPAWQPQRPDAGFTADDAADVETARALHRNRMQTFHQGQVGEVVNERVPDSGVIQRLFRRGSGGIEDFRRTVEALGDHVAGRDALETGMATVLRDFAHSDSHPGGLDPRKVAQFLRQHEQHLREIPWLAERMGTVERATARAQRVIEGERARVQDLERGVARRFLEKEPEEAVLGAIRSSSQRDGAAALMRLVGGNRQAVRGLQRAYVDYLLESTMGSGERMGPNGPVRTETPGTFLNAVDATRGVAEVLFPGDAGRAQFQRVLDVVEDFRSASRVQNTGRPVGSNTVQNASLAHAIGRITGQGTLLGEGRMANLLRWVTRLPEQQMQQVLAQAALDPQMAARLMRKASEADARAFSAWARQNGPQSASEAIDLVVGATSRGLARAAMGANTAATSAVEGEVGP